MKKKRIRRNVVREALTEKFHEFRVAGDDEEASAMYDALVALDFEENLRTYSQLYERYVLSGQINHGPAALGAFYSLMCPKGESPRNALKGKISIDTDAIEDEKIELPAWIVLEFLRAVDLYLSGKRENLNEAFDIGGGERGRKTVLAPVDDFDMAVGFAYFRANRVIRGDDPSRNKTKSEIEAYVAARNPSGKPKGFDSRTIATKLSRIRKAYPAEE